MLINFMKWNLRNVFLKFDEEMVLVIIDYRITSLLITHTRIVGGQWPSDYNMQGNESYNY